MGSFSAHSLFHQFSWNPFSVSCEILVKNENKKQNNNRQTDKQKQKLVKTNPL